MRVYRVTAFTETKHGGNPAGVVLYGDDLDEKAMLQMANEIGFSETAFVMSSEVANFKVRFFTPVSEVDLCGHATIATFNLLRELQVINKGTYTQETKSGILKLDVYKNAVYMEQQRPIYSEVIEKHEIEACFKGIDVDESYPIQVVSTGLRDVIVPVSTREAFDKMLMNKDALCELSKRYNVIGVHAICMEDYNPMSLYVRNFAPLYGIDEESATGTANGALASYLAKHVDHYLIHEYSMNQGMGMNRPSLIHAKLDIRSDEVIHVKIGGFAKLM